MGPDQIFATLDATFIRLDLDQNAVERSKLESNIDDYARETGRYRDLATKESAAQAILDNLELDMLLPDESGAVLVPDSFVSQHYGEYFLTRENGAQVKVVLLEPGPDGFSWVSSPGVLIGDRFVAGPDAP